MATSSELLARREAERAHEARVAAARAAEASRRAREVAGEDPAPSPVGSVVGGNDHEDDGA